MKTTTKQTSRYALTYELAEDVNTRGLTTSPITFHVEASSIAEASQGLPDVLEMKMKTVVEGGEAIGGWALHWRLRSVTTVGTTTTSTAPTTNTPNGDTATERTTK